MKAPVRILLVDDHDIVREGFRALLHSRAGHEVVQEARDGRQAVQIVATAELDLVLMDIRMPLLNGIDATRQILALRPGLKVIGLSAHMQENILAGLFEAGAVGCLSKGCSGTQLFDAIEAVMQGRMYLSPEVTAGALPSSPAGRRESRLSPREREILQLLAEGHSVKEIASLLALSPSTVHTHRQHVLEKTGCHGMADLTRHAISIGMIPVERSGEPS